MSEFEQEDDIDVIDQEGEEPEVDPDAGEEAPEEDFVVDLDPEPEAQPHGEAVRNLRARLKQVEAEKKALEAKVQPQQELEELGKVEQMPKMEGKRMTVILAPKQSGKLNK